jgi:hypothetical protein
MGHFTVPCGLSGIPIKGGDHIVGFNVELASYNHTYSAFIPTNIPVVGYYDDYGRLEDKKGNILREAERGDEEKLILCHKHMWDVASKGFNKTYTAYNGTKSISIMEHFANTKKMLSNPENFISETLKSALDKKFDKNMLRAFMLTSGLLPQDKSVGLHQTLNELIGRGKEGKFRTMWTERLDKGPDLTQEEANMIAQMCMVYKNSYVSGRQLTTTSHCWTIQDTDYKEEAKWHAEVAKFAKSKTKRRK